MQVAGMVRRLLTGVAVVAVVVAILPSAGCWTEGSDGDHAFVGVSREGSAIRLFVLACDMLPTSIVLLSVLGQSGAEVQRAFEDVSFGRSSKELEDRMAEYSIAGAKPGEVLEVRTSNVAAVDGRNRADGLLSPSAETIAILMKERPPRVASMSASLDTASIPEYPKVLYASTSPQQARIYRSPQVPRCGNR